MKKITLQEAVAILENSSAIIIDDNALMYTGLQDLKNDDSNIFLRLFYTNDEGLTFGYDFTEGDNQKVQVIGSNMFLKDDNGEDCKLTILCPQNLEA